MPPAPRISVGAQAGVRQPARQVHEPGDGDDQGREPDADAPAGLGVGVAQQPDPEPEQREGHDEADPPEGARHDRVDDRATGPCRPHHSTAATSTASPTSARPTPSRRWAGSRSRALLPMRRARPPTTWARPSQTARRARPAPRTSSGGPLGRVERARAGLRAGARVGLRAGRRPLDVPEPRLRVAGREVVRVAILRGYPPVTPAPRVTGATGVRVSRRGQTSTTSGMIIGRRR